MPTFPQLRFLAPTVLGACMLLASVNVSYAQEPPEPPAPAAAYDEAEAQAIDGMLMCPVCPAETIDQAQVPLARQMRAIVRQKLAEGQTREEILDYFADRYGQSVIGAPPKSGINLVAWVLPPVAVVAALLIGGLSLRSMTRNRHNTPAPGASVTDTSGDLEPYLDIVDRHLDTPAEGEPNRG